MSKAHQMRETCTKYTPPKEKKERERSLTTVTNGIKVNGVRARIHHMVKSNYTKRGGSMLYTDHMKRKMIKGNG